MDIGKIVNQMTDKLKADPDLLASFKKDPVKTLEKISGIDLPDEQVGALVAAIKAKLGDGGISSILGNILKK